MSVDLGAYFSQLDRSTGLVTEPATLVRAQPVAGGLFDPAIFGPLDGSSDRFGHLECEVAFDGAQHARVPVPPIATRMAAKSDPAMRVPWHGEINDAWIALMQANARRRKLVELRAPAIVLARETEHVQAHFEDVLALHRGEEPPPHHPHEPLVDSVWLMWPCTPRRDDICALLFLDEERMLAQTRSSCRVIDRAGRTIGEPWKPTGALASGVVGDLVLFGGGQREMWALALYGDEGAWPEEAVHRAPLAAYDLAARRWVDVADERLPAWIVDETDVEGTDAFELRTAITRSFSPTLTPTQLAQTRDGRFVYLRMYGGEAYSHDAIAEVTTQRSFVEPPEILEEPPVIAVGPKVAATAPAISYTPEIGWRVIDQFGTVGNGEQWWHRIEGAAQTAWSPSGAQLATIANGELVILDVTPDSASVVSRHIIG